MDKAWGTTGQWEFGQGDQGRGFPPQSNLHRHPGREHDLVLPHRVMQLSHSHTSHAPATSVSHPCFIRSFLLSFLLCLFLSCTHELIGTVEHHMSLVGQFLDFQIPLYIRSSFETDPSDRTSRYPSQINKCRATFSRLEDLRLGHASFLLCRTAV
jgi:hypothetical protein